MVYRMMLSQSLERIVTFERIRFRNMIKYFSKFFIDSCNTLIIRSNIVSEPVCRLLKIESSQDRKFSFKSFQTFLTKTFSAFYVASFCFRNIERIAKNALSSSLKIGYTTESAYFSLYHTGILHPFGYETN